MHATLHNARVSACCLIALLFITGGCQSARNLWPSRTSTPLAQTTTDDLGNAKSGQPALPGSHASALATQLPREAAPKPELIPNKSAVEKSASVNNVAIESKSALGSNVAMHSSEGTHSNAGNYSTTGTSNTSADATALPGLAEASPIVAFPTRSNRGQLVDVTKAGSNEAQLDNIQPTVARSDAEQPGQAASSSVQLASATAPSATTPLATTKSLASTGLSESRSLDQVESTPEPTSSPAAHLLIENVRPQMGLVKVAVFASAQGFLTPEGVQQAFELPDTAATATAQLDITAPCAIAVFQDLDGNGELTKNRLGIPTEPCAFSNGAQIKRGPPKFSEAVIQPSQGSVVIRLP